MMTLHLNAIAPTTDEGPDFLLVDVDGAFLDLVDELARRVRALGFKAIAEFNDASVWHRFEWACVALRPSEPTQQPDVDISAWLQVNDVDRMMVDNPRLILERA